jgi:hypothetical protein
MIRKAQYWRAFTADTKAEAEKAADTWWAEQDGFDRVSGWILPADDTPPGSAPRWTATIIYRSSGAQRTLH